jgi:tetratricopeptide (TPR) repeat protein
MRLIIMFICCALTAQAQSIDAVKQFFDEKKYNEARRVCHQFSEGDKSYSAARYWLGRITFAEGKLDDASDYLEEAIEANDKVADYHYWYGSVLGSIAQQSNTIKQGMLAPKIKDSFEKTVALDPNNLAAHWGLIEFYTQAPGFMGGSWEKAEATAKSIGKIKKGEGYRAVGVVMERQEKFVDAEKQFELAYKEDPSYIYNLSNFYIRQKKNDKAFGLFEELLKRNPEDMAAAYQVGKLSAMSGEKLEAGERHLLKYLAYQPKENEPSHAGANMRLAQIKEKKGNKPEAKKLYQVALKMDPNLKEAKDGLARVSK